MLLVTWSKGVLPFVWTRLSWQLLQRKTTVEGSFTPQTFPCLSIVAAPLRQADLA